MILKRTITEDELLFVKLQCDWSNIAVRLHFAHNGHFLNVLAKDKDIGVRWAVSEFEANETSLKYSNMKKAHPPRF